MSGCFTLHQNVVPFGIKLFLISLASIFLFSSYAKAIEVKLATGINHDPPYVYGNTTFSEEHPGVTIDILRLIEKKSKITFKLRKVPWKRVVFEVRNNRFDGGFHFSFKEKRLSFVAYPIPKGMKYPDPRYSISARSYIIYKLLGSPLR